MLQITERILRDEETDEDLQLIFAPGSSFGGGRPKASVIDQHGNLSIAKFPKGARLQQAELGGDCAAARQQGRHRHLIELAGKAVMLSRRFDRNDAVRIAFLSAMAMMGAKDGERGLSSNAISIILRGCNAISSEQNARVSPSLYGGRYLVAERVA